MENKDEDENNFNYDGLQNFFVPGEGGEDGGNTDKSPEDKKTEPPDAGSAPSLAAEAAASDGENEDEPDTDSGEFKEGEEFEVDGGQGGDEDSDGVVDDPFDKDAAAPDSGSEDGDDDPIEGFDERLDAAAASVAGGEEAHKVDVKAEDAQVDVDAAAETGGDAGGGGSGQDEVEQFVADEKEDYSKVAGKPPVLNKNLISKILVGVFVGLIAFIFIMPMVTRAIKQDRAEKARKQRMAATAASGRNYKDMVVYDEDGNPVPSVTIVDENGEDVAVKEERAKEEKKKEEERKKEEEKKPVQKQAAYVSSGTGWTPPDTRNDALQAKTISGIKGLTSTRSNYATDYGATMEKNAAESAAASSTTDSFASMTAALNQSKNDTISRLLATQAQSGRSQYEQQNDQTGKLAFRNARSGGSGQGEWLGLNTLWEGSILEAELKSAINTDLPGEITAVVTKNVYSSQDGKYLLIPQNSVLIGSYNSEISYSQSRVQVGWYTLIRPDGYRINLGNMNGTDAQGRAGVRGFINDHPMAYLKAIGLMTVFNIINSEFQNTIDTTDNEYAQNLAANSQSVIVQMGEKLVDRAMNVQPTIKIKEGTTIKVFVNSTLTLPPYEEVPAVTQQYRRR